MSNLHHYDPDAMFPRKPKPKSVVGGRVIRWIVFAGFLAMMIWFCTGCANIKTLELDFGGLDVEYFPRHPSQEEKSIFDFGMKTNRLDAVPASWDAPANWDGPLLMPMKRR